MASDILELPAGAERAPRTIELPAPTAWPIVLAFGFTLVFAGLVTSVSVSILGAIFALAGCVGWFRDVLPNEKHESVSVAEKAPTVATSRPQVARVEWMTQELHRARLPLEIYPISAGVKGGIGRKCRHGDSGGALWNCLAARACGIRSTSCPLVCSRIGRPSLKSLRFIGTGSDHRHDYPRSLFFARRASLWCALPMFPRRPILLGGVIAPILWTSLIHSILEALDPVLNQRIDWLWFVFSQVGFGIVAGIVVSRQERIRTWQYLPFAIRAGIEAPGAMDEKSGESHLQ